MHLLSHLGPQILPVASQFDAAVDNLVDLYFDLQLCNCLALSLTTAHFLTASLGRKSARARSHSARLLSLGAVTVSLRARALRESLRTRSNSVHALT